MKKITILFLALFMISGCASPKPTSVITLSPKSSPTMVTPSVTATPTLGVEQASSTETQKQLRILETSLAAIPSPTATVLLPPTMTPLPTGTMFPPKQFDASTTMKKTRSPAARCPVEDQSLVPDFHAYLDPITMDRAIEHPILDFLNRGGSPGAVVDAFNKGFAGATGEILGWMEWMEERNHQWKSFQQDLTNDGVPELIISDFQLHIFGCRNGNYETLLILDGEYKPAEVTSSVYEIHDMNLDGIADMVVSEWVNINGYNPVTYRILEWDGDHFQNEIIQPNFQSFYGGGSIWSDGDSAHDGSVVVEGPWSSTPTALKNVEISDIDHNGTYELILRGGLASSDDERRNGPWRAETDTYMWNGKGFVLYQITPVPPVYRYQALQDADYALFNGEYDQAVRLYQEVIFSDKLDWWSPERRFHDAQNMDAIDLKEPTLTPLPYDGREYNSLSAYAFYRILTIYVKRGWLSDAQIIYQTLQKKYPEGNEGHTIAQLATVFWNEYHASKSLASSCSKAIDFTKDHPDEIIVLNDHSYHGFSGFHYYSAEEICPFKD